VTYSNTLRTLYGSRGQMNLQLVAEMHISPVNGGTVKKKFKKKETQWSFSPSSRLPSPSQRSPLIPLSLSCLQPWPFHRLKKLPGIYAGGCERWPEARFCVRVSNYYLRCCCCLTHTSEDSLVLHNVIV